MKNLVLYPLMQPNATKNVKFCYVQLVECCATVLYNNRINWTSGGFYGYCGSTESGEKISIL